MNLSDHEKAWLGRKWLEAGLGEHASVAAFAYLVLDLVGLGAPPHLIRGAIRAMEDEVEHACLCFGVAREFNGAPASPGPMPLPNRFGNREPAIVLESAIREGCFEEVISAECALAAYRRAVDPRIRTVLERIATDETRHADFSWRAVEWILESHVGLRPLAIAIFSAAFEAQRDIELASDTDPPLAAECYGHLSGESRREVRQRTIDHVIWPRARKLLDTARFGASS